jgi:hypothetical protein
MRAAKRHACSQEPGIQCGGHTLNLEGIRAQAYRLNYRAAKQDASKAEVVDWVEVKNEKATASVTKQINVSPSIEVRVGSTYTVSVPSGFDKSAFTEICKVLSGLCP